MISPRCKDARSAERASSLYTPILLALFMKRERIIIGAVTCSRGIAIMTNSKFINAILAVVFWPVVLALYQLYLLVFQQLHRPWERAGRLAWIILGVFFFHAEYNMYLREDYLMLILVHALWGILSYGILAGADERIVRREVDNESRGICFMRG